MKPHNVEPEGPDLPPRKSAVKSTIRESLFVDSQKYLKAKGWIAAATAIAMLLAYLIYSYAWYEKGVKLNEMYFVAVGTSSAICMSLLFTFFKHRFVRTILLFAAAFYAILELIYVIRWIIFNQPYAYIKLCLFIGLGIGLIYYAYDSFKNRAVTNDS